MGMKDRLINLVTGKIVEEILDNFSPDELKRFLDKGIDYLENKVAASETKLDDTIVLPMLKVIRKAFDIPDND